MSEVEHTDFNIVLRAFAVFNGFDGPSHDELWWRTDGEYAPVTLLVNCNDLFFWGCSDCEHLNSSNIGALEEAVADARTAGDEDHGHLLWVARLRGMRPQGAYYKYFEDGIKPLFDACGPERETGFGNPSSQNAEWPGGKMNTPKEQTVPETTQNPGLYAGNDTKLP